MRNLKQLLGICEHVWEIEDTYKINKPFQGKLIQKGLIYILKCNKCGIVKKKIIRIKNNY